MDIKKMHYWRLLRFTLWFVLIVLMVVLISLNAQPITIHYYFGTFVIFLPVLLLIVLFIGFLVAGLLFLPKLITMRQMLHRLRMRKE